MLAVLLAQVFRFPAHAAENFNSGDDVVAVEPVVEGIFAATKQDGTMTFFCKNTVEVIYPECNAAPGQKCKRDKEAGANK